MSVKLRATMVAVVCGCMFGLASGARAVNFKWDPSAQVNGGTYSWFDSAYWDANGVPTDGVGNIADQEEGNVNANIDVNNGGLGVNLPNSTIIFGRGTFFDSSGDNDSIVGDTIQVNGAGGAPATFDVPVTANLMTSNRHGGVFNAGLTVNEILAQSGHQDKWQINVSPTGTISHVLQNENRGADGGNIDGNMSWNADASVTTYDLVWSRLIVGDGATLTVDTFNYSDYTNQADNNSITPIRLFGDLDVGTFNVLDIASAGMSELADGTYGRTGLGGVDFEVDWIEQDGDGILTVGAGQVPEPSTFILAAMGLLGLVGYRWRRRQK